MSSFVKLTHKQGTPVWVNTTYVETVLTAEGSTRVIMTGTSGRFDVQESLEAVMQTLGVPAEAAAPAAEVAAATAAGRPARRSRLTRG